MATIRELDKKYIWHPFTPMRLWQQDEPLVIQRGQGVYLYDTDGKRYIDGVSSLWCNIHGHCHEYINNAVRAQLDKIAHSSLLGLASESSIRLAQSLIEIAPKGLSKVFYSDSGATAVEIAIKMAFQYQRNIGNSKKDKFLALKESYHGDTIGSVSVGGIGLFHRIFGPLTFPAFFCDSPHPYRFKGSDDQCKEHCLAAMDKLLAEHQEEIAAIVVEPLVQGAAGIIVHPKGFLRGVDELSRKYGVLLIADEVATGFGRTGSMFACEQENVTPDIFCCAKGLTGGYLPLAATLVKEHIYEAFLAEPISDTTFYHGHTYTGNALGCAAARASLELFSREDTLGQLPGKIALLEKTLRQISSLDMVGDVRNCGMMAGVELVEDKTSGRSFDPSRRIGAKLCQRMRDKGVILRPLSDVIVIMPPLAITQEQLTELLAVVTETIENDLPLIQSDD